MSSSHNPFRSLLIFPPSFHIVLLDKMKIPAFATLLWFAFLKNITSTSEQEQFRNAHEGDSDGSYDKEMRRLHQREHNDVQNRSRIAPIGSRLFKTPKKAWIVKRTSSREQLSDVCYEWSKTTNSFIYKRVHKNGEDDIFFNHVGTGVDQGGRHAILNSSIANLSSPSTLWSYPASEGQDRLVLELMDNKTHGFFVDLAARYWHRGSNSFALETYHNWAGICIEPDYHFARGLVMNRTCLVICNNPVSRTDGNVVKFNYKIGGANSPGNEKGSKVTVTLNTILKAANAPGEMDYLSLDVEDHEMAVLESFNFSSYRFNVLSIERPTAPLHKLLVKNGYHWLTQLRGNFGETVYLHKTIPGFVDKMNQYRPFASHSWRNLEQPHLLQPKWVVGQSPNRSTTHILE